MTGILLAGCRLPDGTLGSVLTEGGAVAEVLADAAPRAQAGVGVIDCRGGSVLSGLSDAHCHPFELGRMRRYLDLRGVPSIAGMGFRLAAATRKATPGAWVVGRGWDHESFAEGRMPTRDDIDAVSGQNPVLLKRVCGHISLANSRALLELGMEGERGAGFDVGPSGSLTGVLREGAQEEAFRRMPKPDTESCLDDLRAVEFEAAKQGLTSLACIVSEEGFREELEALAVMAGAPGPSYSVYIPPAAVGFIEGSLLEKRLESGRVGVAGVKLYLDGSLGARTAALREPYADDPGNSGILRYETGELATLLEKLDRSGRRAILHAIGDRAVEQAVEALSPLTGGGNPKGHRIEHASVLPKDLRSAMRKAGIGAAVQPCFVASDTWAEARLGVERARDIYPFRSMLGEGIAVVGSSDAPVETLSPVIGMWAAMSRPGGEASERLSLAQAVALYTGSGRGWSAGGAPGIRTGSRADLTVLDSDVTGMHPAMLRKVGVAATVAGGELLYSFEGS